jgi:hypothetical protein
MQIDESRFYGQQLQSEIRAEFRKRREAARLEPAVAEDRADRSYRGDQAFRDRPHRRGIVELEAFDVYGMSPGESSMCRDHWKGSAW